MPLDSLRERSFRRRITSGCRSADRGWRWCLAPGFLALAIASGAAAGSAVGPSPGETELAAERARLADTDRAFARLSRQQGMRAAFLAYMSDDAVLFRPGPVPGRPFVESRPSPAIELTWAPVYTAVAESGDFGYTTGPYEVRGTGPDRALAEQGYYVTIWRKQADGSWKVVVDQGVATPPPAGADAAALGESGEHAAAGAAAAGSPPAAPSRAAQSAILAADRGFAGDAGAHGAHAAYMAKLASEARLYRDGALPVLGREAIGKALAAGRQVASSWEPTTAAAAAAGDLGYTYGNTALMAPGAPRRIQQTAVYLRLWQRQRDGTYKIVLDLVKALPGSS